MRFSRLILLLPSFLALFTTCGPPEHRPDCFKSTGPKTAEHRALPAFRAVEVFDNIRLVLATDGQPASVDITAGRNLLPEITTVVNADGKLVLRNRNKCSFVRSQKMPITVVAHVADAGRLFTIFHNGEETIRTAWPGMRLDSVFLHQRSAGDSELDLRAQYIWLDAYEYGDVTLRGSTNDLNVTMGGIGFLKAQEMTAQNAYVRGLLDGDLHVRATNILGLQLNGRGNGYYYGQPQHIDLHAFGSGKITQVK